MGQVSSDAMRGRSLVVGLLTAGAAILEVVDARGARVQALLNEGVCAAALDQRNDGGRPRPDASTEPGPIVVWRACGH
jgi:hypothetical protein